MKNENFYYLGKITKLFSFKGEVVCYFDVDDISEYFDIKSIFIDFQGDLIPYVIEKINFNKNNTATVKLKYIDTEETAQRLVNCSLMMPLSSLPKLEGNKFYFHEVIGFDVFDEKEGIVGVLESINDNSTQAIFEIKSGITEIMLPIIDDFIIDVDRKNKKILVRFPEGLLDVYRGNHENDED